MPLPALRSGIALAICLALSAPLAVQAQAGSGVTASERANSAGREIGFAAQAPAGAALVVLMDSANLPADLPLGEAERAAVEAAIKAANYAGKANEMLSLRGIGAHPRVLLAGTGPTPAPLARQEAAGKAAQELGSEAAPVALLGAGDAVGMADAALGFALGQYRFDRLKSRASASLPAVTVVGGDAAGARSAWSARHAGLAEGVRFARDLITEPASVIYPETFVERTRAAFSGLPGVSIEVLDEAAMRRLGMGALLGVGQGSRRPSRLMLITYRGADTAPLALVGKGITFDSGGLSIKPASGMARMKGDMSGAAAVTGTVLALARSRAPVHVIAVAALAENMPDGNAQRPGDVVRTLSGKTIEIINTDAEGRLVLADAIEYVTTRRNPAAIIDIATLTGAAAAALGEDYAALFARDEGLAAGLEAAGRTSGELVWRMPLHPRYADAIRSEVADVTNQVEGGSPGAGLAAAFVGHFVDPAMPWAHIDMAGTMASSGKPLAPKGMSGYGVRLLEAFARDWRPPARD